jgi:hypothetical protein
VALALDANPAVDEMLRYASNHERFDSSRPSWAILIPVIALLWVLGAVTFARSFPLSFFSQLLRMLAFAFWIFFVGRIG